MTLMLLMVVEIGVAMASPELKVPRVLAMNFRRWYSLVAPTPTSVISSPPASVIWNIAEPPRCLSIVTRAQPTPGSVPEASIRAAPPGSI